MSQMTCYTIYIHHPNSWFETIKFSCVVITASSYSYHKVPLRRRSSECFLAFSRADGLCCVCRHVCERAPSRPVLCPGNPESMGYISVLNRHRIRFYTYLT